MNTSPQGEATVGGHGGYAGLYSTAAIAAAVGHPLERAAAREWVLLPTETAPVVRLADWADARGIDKVGRSFFAVAAAYDL